VIVRRFLIASGVARLFRRTLPGAPVTEGHFAAGSDRSIHVHVEDDKFLLVLRAGAQEVGDENVLAITRDHADALVDASTGTISYELLRMEIESGHTAVVHVFSEPSSLTLVEVQFRDTSEAERFEAPLWFATDVSDCDNQTIALHQLSLVTDIPISNDVVEAALDALEHQELRLALGRDGAAPVSSLAQLERVHAQMMDAIDRREPAPTAMAG
jgi:CYTH domain-containing protein